MQALTLIALARFSNISTFGEYATGVAVGAIAIGAFGFGLPTLVLRSEARLETAVARSAMQLGALGAVTSAVLVAGVMLLLIPGVPVEVVMASATFTASELWLNLIQNLLLGAQRELRATWVIVLRRAIPLGFTLLALTAGIAPYSGLLIGSLGASIGLGLSVRFMHSRSASWKSVLFSSRHYWIANVASMFQQLDVVFIRQGIGSAPAAAYSSAFRLASPVHIVTTAITSKMIPALSAARGEITLAQRSRRYLLTGIVYATVILLCAPLAAWAGPFLLGKQYAAWSWVFTLTFVNSALSVVNQIQAGMLYAAGRAKLVSRTTIFSTVIGLVIVALGAVFGNLFVAVCGTISIQVALCITLASKMRRVHP